ncbi:EamA family transporter [Falsihalocynthiibacter sp. SS001]|uniref:EamA family transporter n=1 Tax=Falsihalocynthiibacter sp. SS001 TaxID=3349698 RepID=UPI0036D3A821
MRLALILMLISMSLIPLGDTFGKLLLTDHNATPFYVAWSRFVLGAVCVLPFLNSRHFDARLYLDWRIWLRGALLTGGVSSILTALETEPLQNVIGAFFVGPILSYFLAAFLLREQITWPRTLLLLAGFVGILLIVKPGFGMSTGLLFAVLAGLFYGCFLTSSRWLSDVAPPRALLFS